MKSYKLLKLCVFSVILVSCYPPSPARIPAKSTSSNIGSSQQGAAGSNSNLQANGPLGSSNQGASNQGNSNQGYSNQGVINQGYSSNSGNSNNYPSQPSIAGGVPSFQTADLGSGFNTNTKTKLSLKPTQDANKVFLVQRIMNYRPIWMNMSLKTKINNWNVFSQSGSKTISSNLSVYQPITSFGGSDNLAVSIERGDSYKTIGHYFNSLNLNTPTEPTAILSLYAISSNDPLSLAIAPPIAYKKVYSFLGPLTSDLLQSCTNVNNSYKAGGLPNDIDVSKCNEVTMGGQNINDYLNVLMQGSTTTGVGNLSSYYQMQTLVVWEPVPPPGYQCLGQIVTNTPDQPVTSSDSAGIYAQYQQTLTYDANGNLQIAPQWDYPMYCVQQKYVSPGKLQLVASNDQVYVYKVTANDNTGYAVGNLFWAVAVPPGTTSIPSPKVYVLNNSFVRTLPDIMTK